MCGSGPYVVLVHVWCWSICGAKVSARAEFLFSVSGRSCLSQTPSEHRLFCGSLGGRMFSWGQLSGYGLGLKEWGGSSPGQNEFGVSFTPLKRRVRDVSARRQWVALVLDDRRVHVVHSPEESDGQTTRTRPRTVALRDGVQAVSCGDHCVILLSGEGSILSLDSSGIPRPRLPRIQLSQVACGNHHSLALTKDGQVYVWGWDTCGQLGLGHGDPCVMAPRCLKSLSAIPLVQVCAGGDQSFSLSLSGTVFGWGRNASGQLGLGDTRDRNIPTPVLSLNMRRTVCVSSGEDHTALLTKDGTVFTFGSGQHGQLGHNSLQNELRPRLVVELLGAKGTGIACGRYHTLVLTDSNKVYSFGLGEQGQLGRRVAGDQSVPLPVHLTHDTSAGRGIEQIYAGGDCCFAVCTSEQESHVRLNKVCDSHVTQPSLDAVMDKWTSDSQTSPRGTIQKEIQKVLSSVCCLNRSFLDRRNDGHFRTSLTCPGLNWSLVWEAFQKLVKTDQVLAEVKAGVQTVLPSLGETPAGVEGLRVYLLLAELLWALQEHGEPQSAELLAALAAAILRLPSHIHQVLGDWWLSMKRSSRIRHVEMWKKALSFTWTHCRPRGDSVRDLLQVLQLLHEVNKKTARPKRLRENVFCVNINFNLQFLNEDLILWCMPALLGFQDGSEKPTTLCQFPFVMDLRNKKKMFENHTEFTKNVLCNFELWLRRASVVEDTFQQLLDIDHSTCGGHLVVHLDQDPKVTNVYRDDFFLHFFDELMSPESGMFMFNDSETLVWFPAQATTRQKRFFTFGLLCGLALHNNSIIHLPFPMALFKKLLDVKPSLEDLLEFSPTVGRCLLLILEDYDDDDIENLEMTFSISWGGVTVELDPEIPQKPLTSQNKEEFVDAYVNHCFNTSVEEVFEEFREGFLTVCDQHMLKLFHPEELRQLMVGRENYDWEQLKENTVYDWEYHAGHPTIQMFWKVFEELSEEQKKAFLLFLTGRDRVPVLGMDQIVMRVRVLLNSTQMHLPEALTCHSILDLPLYRTKCHLKAMLLEALSSNRGFFD